MSRNKFYIVCAQTALSIPLISGCMMLSSPSDPGTEDGSFLLNLPAVVEGSSITYELYCSDQNQISAKETYKLVGSSGSADSGFSSANGQGSYKFSFPTQLQAKSCYMQGKGAADGSVKSKIRFLERDGLYFDSDPKAVTNDGGKLKLAITVRARYQLNNTASQSTGTSTRTATASGTATQVTTERNSSVTGAGGFNTSVASATNTATQWNQGTTPSSQSYREVQLIMDGAPQSCPSHICNP